MIYPGGISEFDTQKQLSLVPSTFTAQRLLSLVVRSSKERELETANEQR